MAGPGNVAEMRADRMEDPPHLTGGDRFTRAGRNPRNRKRGKRRTTDDSEDIDSPSGQNQEDSWQGELEEQATDRDGGDTNLSRGVLRARFYRFYYKFAEEYDKEFMKKHSDDLAMTMMFASLLSVVISVFITQVHAELRSNLPRFPRWPGYDPSQVLVRTRETLFAGLALSLLATFLAMLCRQWLNRYASVDVSGSIVERSQTRQQKLDSIVGWHFEYAAGLPTLISHAVLLLLGVILSIYLWEVDTTAGTVVELATSFGVLSYLLITVAGAIFVNCPYQTPGSQILRHIVHSTPLLRSLLSTWAKRPACLHLPSMVWDYMRDDRTFSPKTNDIFSTLSYVFFLPVWFLIDAYRLWQVVVELFVPSTQRAYLPLWWGLEQETAVLDVRCISWTLQTLVNRPVRLLGLNYLSTTTLAHFDPALFTSCFDVLADCINVNHEGKVTATQNLEQLAMLSAQCCLRTLSHITCIDPTVEEIRHRYTSVFPPEANFDHLHFSRILSAIHHVFYQTRKFRVVLPTNTDKASLITWRARRVQRVRWEGYNPPIDEQITVAHALAKLAVFEYRRHEKVPRWLLRFAVHSLSQNPLPPTLVIVDCLSIIAIDLGCRAPNTATFDESAQLKEVSRLIVHNLETINDSLYWPFRKCKAISALLLYAAHPGIDGRHVTLDTLLCVMRNPWWTMWNYAIPTFFNTASPLAIVLVSPHSDPLTSRNPEDLVKLWAAAATTVAYTEEVALSVVDVLLHIASSSYLLPLIPVGIWGWLKKRPSLPPVSLGGPMAKMGNRTLLHVRGLGDVDILKSYLFVVWSEWDLLMSHDFYKTCELVISVDFRGREMGNHRQDLIDRLDYILEQLDRGLPHLRKERPYLPEGTFQKAKAEYRGFRGILVQVGEVAMWA